MAAIGRLARLRDRPARRLHPFVQRGAGARDGRAALCRHGRSDAHCAQRRCARRQAEMGDLQGRRPVSAFLRCVAACRRDLGQAAPAQLRSPARLSGNPSMIGLLEPLVRPLLQLLDAETAHRLAIAALKMPPFVKLTADDPRLAVRAFGLNFPNPVGMAAGFDKHAEVADALLAHGFGFVEVGTVTPLPQSGNPRPRIFRLNRDEGVINRLGFNSEGAAAVLRRLAARAKRGGIVGINIGANKESTDRIGDYVRLVETFAGLAGYFAVNISSPNTPGLRELQRASALDALLGRVMEARARLSGPTIPVLVKIA